MASELILSDSEVVLVRWYEMTISGIDRADGAVRQAKAFGPVIYVGLVGSDAAMPSEDVRKRLADGLDSLSPMCQSVSLVLDGTGMKFSAMRSAAAALFLIKGNRQMRMFSSLAECLADRAPRRADTVLTKAKGAGIVA
jgi:hypothetical protein